MCEFCVGSPLACVSGVTGADLKKRMVNIMTDRISRKLNLGKKLLLSAAALLALALPIVFGLVNATPTRAQADDEAAGAGSPKYTVSIKPSPFSTVTHDGGVKHMEKLMFGPDGFVAANIPLQKVIQEAYGVQANQIAGVPDWVKSAAYDIEVKIDRSDAGNSQTVNPDLGPPKSESQLILRSILADRFKLTLHRETRDLSSYVLVVAEDGSKLQPDQATDSFDATNGPGRRMIANSMRMKLGDGQTRALEARGMPTADFASLLSRELGTVVVDKTGLAGKYDFKLNWTADAGPPPDGSPAPESADASGDSTSSIFTAIQQQLGLKLEAQRAPAEILVIDHVAKPSAN